MASSRKSGKDQGQHGLELVALKPGALRRSFATMVSASGAPYGYRITVWSTGALLIHFRQLPEVWEGLPRSAPRRKSKSPVAAVVAPEIRQLRTPGCDGLGQPAAHTRLPWPGSAQYRSDRRQRCRHSGAERLRRRPNVTGGVAARERMGSSAGCAAPGRWLSLSSERLGAYDHAGWTQPAGSVSCRSDPAYSERCCHAVLVIAYSTSPCSAPGTRSS